MNQVWKFYDYSPKKTAKLVMVQMELLKLLPTDVQENETEAGVSSVDQNRSSRTELEARVQKLEDQLEVEMIHADHSTLQFCHTGCESEQEDGTDESDNDS